MEDISKRLHTVEDQISDIRVQVHGFSAQLPHLATRADLSSLEASLDKRLIGTAIAALGAAIAVTKLVH
jgi:hypothetical protein